jgi:predicted negative regulator of RcsB-dependent stress response
MKVILVIAIIAAIGYFSWKFKEAKRIKNANKPSIHKVSVKSTTAVKSTKQRRKEIDDDTAMSEEIMKNNQKLR